jgi:peptidoglycan/xylan/chitin deacetylase (PgdA/CDA1 family)
LNPSFSTLRRLRAALRGAGIVAGGRAPGEGAVVLAYHDVDVDATGYTVTPAALAAHVRALRRSGFDIVPLDRIVRALGAGDPVDRLAAITFDDALVGVHEHAVPLLTRLGVTPTIFAVAHELGRRPAFWPEARRTMTEAELRDALTAGAALGSHTLAHPSLLALDDTALDAELRRSRVELEDRFGKAVDVLAYPFGHHDPRIRAAAGAAGYRCAFTFLNGRVIPRLDRFRLPRLTMGSHHGRVRFAYHLARPPDAWPDTQLDRVEHVTT